MSMATLAQIHGYLTQLKGTDYDAALQECLDRAEDLIALELTFAFAGYGAETTRSCDSRGGRLLHLPYYGPGSLVSVSLLYQEPDGPPTPVLAPITLPPALAFTDYEAEADDHTALWRPTGWPAGRYSAVAKWGYGAAPVSVVQLCLEVARDLWYAKEASMSAETVGVAGQGETPVQYAWTARQYRVLEGVRRKYSGDVGFA